MIGHTDGMAYQPRYRMCPHPSHTRVHIRQNFEDDLLLVSRTTSAGGSAEEIPSFNRISPTEAQDLCELLEERSIDKSTVFTTQLPLDRWGEIIGDPVITDAIRDRLEHRALKITITAESYRGVKARKLAVKKKEA